MSNVTSINIYVTNEIAKNSDTNAYQARGEVYPTPKRDELKALVNAHELASVFMEYFCLTNLTEVDDLEDLLCCSAVTLRAPDPDRTVKSLNELTKGTTLDGVLNVVVGETYPDPDADDHQWKSIEIYYSIEEIPPGYENPLDYRNAAMELIEAAMTEADAGEWEGAESGMGDVNFGFSVEDFDQAEKIVRAAIKGTPYEGIREITRFDSAEQNL